MEPHLDDCMGWCVFEGMAREGFRRHHSEWRPSGARDRARREGHDRNRRSIEPDIVAKAEIIGGDAGEWSLVRGLM